MANQLPPPFKFEFACSSQSLFGNDAAVEVSSNLMRVLFSVRIVVLSEKLGLFGQSEPTHRLLRMTPSALVSTTRVEREFSPRSPRA